MDREGTEGTVHYDAQWNKQTDRLETTQLMMINPIRL